MGQGDRARHATLVDPRGSPAKPDAARTQTAQPQVMVSDATEITGRMASLLAGCIIEVPDASAR